MTKRTLISSGYEAEFFIDRKSATPLFHYVITPKGSAEIVMWGQDFTMEEAERSALAWMTAKARDAFAAAP